jgi:hypothetical protein
MSEPVIKVGQVWRRKKDGKLILIVRAAQVQWLGVGRIPYDGFLWGGYDYEGNGQARGGHIRAHYTLEPEAVDE